MNSLLFLTGVGFAAAFGFAISETSRTSKFLSNITAIKSRFPSQAVEKLLLIAQIPELAHIVEHATTANVIAILLLFGLWLALKSGTETEF